ncbi:phage tail terminator protein [Marichromatium bheemlicum]|uniref:DUF3168 domain-containing protein n=1 Tax=Marichromatium bheemlicum TaxID=365339 RepID=A0ABX1ICQ1_9GAMM|nr:hypothetical protein [Marichromatium bheemlicum]NKN33972.1 hypothetical protein [Marichromatium bheemlicum]
MSFLAIGAEIHERLEIALGESAWLLDSTSLAEMHDLPRPGPRVSVVYGGGQVCKSRPDGRAVRLEQRWQVIVGVCNVPPDHPGASVRTEVGVLVDRVLAALLGWRPPSAARALTLVELPESDDEAGLQLIPLVFTTDILRQAV